MAVRTTRVDPYSASVERKRILERVAIAVPLGFAAWVALAYLLFHRS